jgi:hypothetical protein
VNTYDLQRWVQLQEDKGLWNIVGRLDDRIPQRCGLLSRLGSKARQVRRLLSVEDIWHRCIKLLKTGWLQSTSVGIGLCPCSATSRARAMTMAEANASVNKTLVLSDRLIGRKQ